MKGCRALLLTHTVRREGGRGEGDGERKNESEWEGDREGQRVRGE